MGPWSCLSPESHSWPQCLSTARSKAHVHVPPSAFLPLWAQGQPLALGIDLNGPEREVGVCRCLETSRLPQPRACVEPEGDPGFLAQPGCLCRTIRFWDLEKFQVVSCIEGEPGPVRYAGSWVVGPGLLPGTGLWTWVGLSHLHFLSFLSWGPRSLLGFLRTHDPLSPGLGASSSTLMAAAYTVAARTRYVSMAGSPSAALTWS